MGSKSNKAGARGQVGRDNEGHRVYIGSRRSQDASGQFGGKAGFKAVPYKHTTSHNHPRQKRDYLEVPAKELTFLKNGSKLAVFVFLFFAFIAAPLSALEDSSQTICDLKSRSPEHSNVVKSSVIRTVHVSMFIRIPASRLVFHDGLDVPIGTTAGGAIEKTYSVIRGIVCCDATDIRVINGLANDPENGKYWIVLVNGNRQNSSARTQLKEGDTLEWIYDESPDHDPKHVRLEDWATK